MELDKAVWSDAAQPRFHLSGDLDFGETSIQRDVAGKLRPPKMRLQLELQSKLAILEIIS